MMDEYELEKAYQAKEHHRKRVQSYRGGAELALTFGHDALHVNAIAEVLEGMTTDDIANWIEDMLSQNGGWADNDIGALERIEAAQS